MTEKDYGLSPVRLPKVTVTLNGVSTSIHLDELPNVANVFTRFGLSFIVSPLDD